MDYSKYLVFDELLKIGDYKKLSEDLKDYSSISSSKTSSIDQVIQMYYYFSARLELGKYSEVEKFLSAKSFQSWFREGNEIVKLFLHLLQLNYLFEKEIFESIQGINIQILQIEKKFANEDFLIEKLGFLFLYQYYLTYRIADFDQSSMYYDKCTQIKERFDTNNYYLSYYYNITSIIDMLKGNTTKSLSGVQQSYDCSVLTKNIKLQSLILLRQANGYYQRGQTQKAKDNCESAFLVGKKIGNVKLMGESLFTNAKISHQVADLEQASGFASKALDYFTNIGFKYGIMEVHNLNGNIEHLKGELDAALKLFETSLSEAKANNDLFSEAMIINNIGNIYSDKGLFDKAIDYYSKGLELATLINYKWMHSVLLGNLGYNYRLKADYKKSIEYYEQSLEEGFEIGPKLQLAEIYFNLVTLNLEIKNNDKSNIYFERLRELANKDENKLLFYYYETSRGLLTKSKNRMSSIAESQDIFKQLLKEDIPHSSLKQIIIINLADLMIKELTLNQNQEIFDELNMLIDNLYNHGKEQHIYHIIIESLILKSKISLIQGNIKQAERLLVQSSILAEEKNLTYLAKKTDLEYKEFRKQVTHWAEIIESNTPLIEKIKLAEIQNYIDDLQKMAYK